ncbi:MAG: porin [Alphaproteobacteria bacterium]|nr:porin [Alphaproteobacteria bacterium]
MKKFLYVLLPFAIVSPAGAGEFVYDYSAVGGAFYGYSEFSKHIKHYKHHNTPSYLEVFSSAGYEFDADTSLMINADAQIAGAKEVEDYNHGDWGENVYATLQSHYGDVSVGQVYNAAYQMAVGAPSVGYFKANNSPITDFLANPNWQRNSKVTSYRTLNSTYLNTDADAMKISYITPEFYGTKAAFSYTPDSYSKAGLLNKDSAYEHKSSYAAGLYNLSDFGYFEAESSLGYAYNRKNNQEISAGLSLYRKGWTLGGSYRKSFTSGSDYALAGTSENGLPAYYDGFRKGDAYNVGLSYEIGPFKTGVTYFASAADKTADKNKTVTFANRFAFNKYAEVYAAAAWSEYKSEIEGKNNGTAVICGLEFNI